MDRLTHFYTGAGGHVIRMSTPVGKSDTIQEYLHLHPQGGSKAVGFITVNEYGEPKGAQGVRRQVGDLFVDPEHRGSGVSSGLWDVASHDNPDIGELHHSPERTEAGERFAQRVSGDRPDLIPPRHSIRGVHAQRLAEREYPFMLKSLNQDLFHELARMDTSGGYDD